MSSKQNGGTIPRRALLKGAAVAAASVAEAREGEYFLCLWQEWGRADAAAYDSQDKSEAAEFAARDHYPPLPEPLARKTLFSGEGLRSEQCITSRDIEEWAAGVTTMLGAETAAEWRKQRRKFLADYTRECRAVLRDRGVLALKAKTERERQLVYDIEERMLETPAADATGVTVKLWFAWNFIDGGLYEQPYEELECGKQAVSRALDDLERITRLPSSDRTTIPAGGAA